MSLVPTWVLATDGQFYKDPIFSGKGWFLCFDDDDPPELVIRMEEGNTDKILLRMLAVDILNGLGLGYHIMAKPRPIWAYRCFDQYTDMTFAGSVFIQITDPVPVPTTYEAVGDRELVLMSDCVVYDLGRTSLCRPIK